MSAKVEYIGFFFSVLAFVALAVVFLGNSPRNTSEEGMAIIQNQTEFKQDQYLTSLGFDGNKSQIISLNKGEISIYLEYQGYSTFKAKLLQPGGTLVSELADANGPYRQTQIIDVPETGDYILDVKTIGQWLFTKE